MQPNTNNSPFQSPHPVVPNVPEVPDVPQIPQTPVTPAQSNPPKITGVSLPAGSYRKNESPTQRSEKIYAANNPKPKPVQKEKLLHKPVTMEEIENYRKKSANKKRIFLISSLVLLVGGGIAGFIIYTINHQNSYNELSCHYNSNIPIVINRINNNPVLISQSGKVISEKYSKIEEFNSDRSLAYYQNEEEKTISAIIDNNGKEIFTTDKTLGKINDGQNFIYAESGKSYLLDKNGKKIDERPLRTVSYRNNQDYFLISDDSNYAVINSKGETKISGAVENNNILSFAYANNKFDNNSYCAFIVTRKKESKLYVYNCETASEVANIENVYYDASFPNVNSSFLETEQGSSYFYQDKMIYNSNTKDIELYGGIIQSAKDERYFNPVTQKTSESFPNESLIPQDKLSKKTALSEDCDYTNHKESKLIKICDNIYYNNKLLELSTSKFNYGLFDEKLDDFLSFNGKHYIYKEDKSKGAVTIYDVENNKDVYTLDNRYNNRESDSRFVAERKDNIIKVTDLATGKSAEYEDYSYISLESNYYIVTTNDDEKKTIFYNSNHKQIYTEDN